METNSTKLTIIATGLFIAGLAGLGIALKPKPDSSSGGSKAADAADSKKSVDSGGLAFQPPGQNADGSALSDKPQLGGIKIPEMRETAQVLNGCRLKIDPSNDADSFCVSTKNGDYRFALYFADAPDLHDSNSQTTREQMQHFDGLDEARIRELAGVARDWVQTALTGRTFDVFTRWERANDESQQQEITFRAFVFLENEKSQMVNLSSLLIRYGLARISPICNEPPPGKLPAAAYREQLTDLQNRGKAERQGGWAMKSIPGTGTIREASGSGGSIVR
jgi:hypothetical protein